MREPGKNDTNSSGTITDNRPLDTDGPDMVRLSLEEATDLGERALRCIGYTEDEARTINNQLIDNALCGYRFAGLPRILAIRDDPRTHEPRRSISVDHATPVSARVDGGNNIGYIAASFGTDLAIAKASSQGFSVVGVFNSFKSGRNAYYAERIVEAGFVVVHTACGKPFTLPIGGRRPALGTNPICIGFPSDDGPVILDLGTASMQLGEVLMHAQIGKTLPEGVGFDSAGLPTRDAATALDGGVCTFGGYKGFALSFAVQTLGLLAGSAFARGNVQDYAFLFIVIDPGLLIPEGTFPDLVTELKVAIKSTPLQPGFEEIRLPGERALRERRHRRKEGIVLDREVFVMLDAIASSWTGDHGLDI